ncbi:hypothetical protein V8E53_004731 [Lactarius tabidus]
MPPYDPDLQTELQPTNNIQAERIRGLHKDSSGKLWSIYLVEADEQDEEITAFWRGEADSILVFTGLFSGIVSAFLSLSIQDLKGTGASSSTGVSSIIIPYGPVCVVNVLWLFSLILSLSSALFATLFQQWSRRYLELTQRRVAPHRRARIRGYMFNGISTFKMSLAVKLMPVLLHLSIFSFFVGLFIYVWFIDRIVGYCVLAFICVFTYGYVVLTMLPYIYLNSPYSTPFSEFAWRTSQRFLLAIFFIIRRLQGLFLSWRKLINQRPEELASRWTRWENVVKTRIKTHKKWLKDGLQKSIMDGASAAPSEMDKGALAWTLTVLDDDREFEDFVARVPGFFDSVSIPYAPSVILLLMDDQSAQFDPILGSRINDLLKTCVPGTSPLTDQLRKNRLRVCLRTLWYCAKGYNQSCTTDTLPSYVRSTFANPEMTRRIQSEEDLAARLIGRCFSSLVVKKLTQDIGSRTDQSAQDNKGLLSCLAPILGKTSAEVATLLSQPGAINFANTVTLISSEMDTLANKAPGPYQMRSCYQSYHQVCWLFSERRLRWDCDYELLTFRWTN